MKKAQGISINMLVIIALGVFILFLVLGFVSGGWGRFAGSMGAATEGLSAYDAVVANCQAAYSAYSAAGKPEINTSNPRDIWGKRLLSIKHADLNGDGEDEKYYCIEKTAGGSAFDQSDATPGYSPVLSGSKYQTYQIS